VNELINLLQWPAMAVTIAAAWLVASSHRVRRNIAFWVFLLSNALWITWAVYVGAPALILLQVGLAAMNIRGALKNTSGQAPSSDKQHADSVLPIEAHRGPE